MTSEKSARDGVEAAAVDERAAVLREFVHERFLHARAELALGDQRNAAHLAVGDEAARDAARLVFRQQRELIELGAGVYRVAEKIERELGRPGGAHRHHRSDILLGERTHDECRAVIDGMPVGAGHGVGGGVVDSEQRTGGRILLQISGDEAVAHGDADALGTAR